MTEGALLEQLRALCASFPEVTERQSHGMPSFFVRGKKTLCHLANDHHGDGRLALWVPAPPGVQEEMVSTEPERYFRPPYVGPSGWIGYRFDVMGGPDWEEVRAILTEAYRKVAPKTLVSRLDDHG